jgi:serine/threonine protein kinase
MSHTANTAAPNALGSRYDIGELLGRGGMAGVYRATDRVGSRPIALKQLVVDTAAPERASAAVLFEREFHTLMQLRHPHVIEVYDYGLGDDGSPFYTMELLDGGDLRDRTPVGWQEACRIAFDVCSALALLHSRRLLHRDVSPRNIRCTPHGHAKLIDFGAVAPMTDGGAQIVGTPAFTAPETLQRLALDARTDLYSLGATLYYALTARLPYPARSFSELLAAWRVKPVPPSALAADIPAALDDLVLALISVEPGLRPQSAFDVMQRLAVCADLPASESDAVSRSYLSTPTLVGRDDVLAQVRDKLRDSRLQGVTGVIFTGPPGAGRSRLLDACAMEAQTRGLTVLRATASGTHEPFAVAHALTKHLLDALPQSAASREFPDLFARASASVANDNTAEAAPRLRNFADPTLEPGQLQHALRRFWTSVSLTHPLLIAVDDVHKIDEPSAALLAELIDKAKRGGILVALTADSEDAGGTALTALSRRCTSLPLAPLTLEQTRALFDSLFGDVAQLGMLASEIQRVALGNPRQTLELAQHLVDRGLIRYASGGWTLPRTLAADDLPRSAAAAMHARIGRLSAHARFLAEAQALAFYDTFTDQDYRALLPTLSALEIELALSELLTAQALVRDGVVYMLAHRVWIAALSAELDPEQTRLRHRALATLYASSSELAVIHHAFSCGLDEQGLDAIDTRNERHRTEADYMKLVEQNASKVLWCFPRAIVTAQALGRSAREVNSLRRTQCFGSVVAQGPPDRESMRLWFEQLTYDSGLDLYRRDSESTNPTERLTRALQTAHQRYLATPEHERVYAVDEAIRKLGEYVVVSIAIGARTLDSPLLRNLPDALEPFAPLSPLLDAIWNNARATRHSHCFCQNERALALWRETLLKLDAYSGTDESFTVAMRNAIAYAIGMTEAQLGIATAADWAERLDHDIFQRVSALDLRRIVRLEQGDAVGADRLRRQAEVLALQVRAPQMFKTLLLVELAAYTNSRDLAGVAQVVEQLKPLAARIPSWEPALRAAEANFQLVRGDYDAAKTKFEQCLERTRFDEHGDSPHMAMWIISQAGLADCLFGLGRYEEARNTASSALTVCESRQIVAPTFDLVRILALAEGKLGDARAAARLDELIAVQNQLGATGLRIGLSYEARARVAIWSADATAFERFAELTAREYRLGARTALAARYERMINEAARCGMHIRAALGDIEALARIDPNAIGGDELLPGITRSMAGTQTAEKRTQLALQTICAALGASIGHLYLITPAGLVLRASRGAAEPDRELAQHVNDYLSEKRQRSEDMDDMVTGELPQDDAPSALIQAAGVSYELLPLSCIVDSSNMLVGIAAIEVSAARIRNEKQAQLLNALATNLLQAGDSPGLPFAAKDPNVDR